MSTQFTFTTSAKVDSWLCKPCETEFAILTVVRSESEEYGTPIEQIFNWGNPDRQPFCPHCGSKAGVSREISGTSATSGCTNETDSHREKS